MESKKLSRKSVLKIVAWVIGGISGFLILRKHPVKGLSGKKRFVMVMDLDKCIGCNACTVACKSENGVALGGFRTRVLEKEDGVYPNTSRYFLPVMCNHCENAPCIPVCPNNAIIRRDNGLVDIDKDLCKGSGLCILACPYGAIYMNPDVEPGPLLAHYPARAIFKSDKCNFCKHRIDEGLEPACSNTCPTDARIFGDLGDTSGKIYRMFKDDQLTGLLEEIETRPQVYYKGGKKDLFEIKKSINNFKG